MDCAVCQLPLSEHAEAFGFHDGPFAGTVNNCARTNGGTPGRCQMCSGTCYPPHRFTPPTISSFVGPYRFLSNFYPWEKGSHRPYPSITVVAYGRAFPSSEHAFQAAKCAFPGDYARFQEPELTAAQAKLLGRKVPLRADWEAVKVHVMWAIVADKFNRNSQMKEQLLATGEAALVEGNHWGDRYWGVSGGVGENMLGRILMAVRGKLLEGLSG